MRNDSVLFQRHETEQTALERRGVWWMVDWGLSNLSAKTRVRARCSDHWAESRGDMMLGEGKEQSKIKIK